MSKIPQSTIQHCAWYQTPDKCNNHTSNFPLNAVIICNTRATYSVHLSLYDEITFTIVSTIKVQSLQLFSVNILGNSFKQISGNWIDDTWRPTQSCSGTVRLDKSLPFNCTSFTHRSPKSFCYSLQLWDYISVMSCGLRFIRVRRLPTQTYTYAGNKTRLITDYTCVWTVGTV